MGNVVSSNNGKPTPLSQVKLMNVTTKEITISPTTKKITTISPTVIRNTKEITISPSFRSFSTVDRSLSMYNNPLYTFDKPTNIKKISIIFKNSKGVSNLYSNYFNCTKGNYFLFIKKLSIRRVNGTEEILNSYLFKNTKCNFDNLTLLNSKYGSSSSKKSIVISASTNNEIELYNTGINVFNRDRIFCDFKISNNNNTFSIQQNINFYISFVFYSVYT